ncbi:MAG: hypothetical protein AB7E59_04675 [Pusillimonas sp.]
MADCSGIFRWQRRQRGQAMAPGLLLAGLMALVMVRYFGTGQMVGARAVQTHALDAAAYSGALVQARAFNTAAFINRAHVGHQVAMAHLVTLGSWALFGGNEAGRLLQGNPPAYLIAMMFGPSHGAAYAAAAMASGRQNDAQAWGVLTRNYAEHDRVVHDTLQQAQHRMISTLASVRDAAMRQVLDAGYPDKNYTLEIIDDELEGYLSFHRGAALVQLVAQATAHFDFLAPRDHTARNSWMVNPRCPHLRHELRRRGRTRLTPQGTWESTDTQSYHALRSNKWIGCYFREYAMGWGWISGLESPSADMPHVDAPPENFSAQDFWKWAQTSTDWNLLSGLANPLANSYAVATRPVWPARGLPAYYDVRQAGASNPLRFAVRLRRSAPTGETIVTHSTAETFFQRPRVRTDLRTEHQSLFNPYWQARVAASPVWRFVAVGVP